MKVYIDRADWWVGYYRGPDHHYVCPLPTVVIRWPRAATLAAEPADTTRYGVPDKLLGVKFTAKGVEPADPADTTR